ncbi:MAG TPA: ACT domain-containing protein [Actinomycetota bacterium]|nr:ACT domain-containing protein [Actinomycetota bacterium]
MHELTITAIGRDRPGIVAGVTKVLFELGCNLADCSMTLLRGQFAMIMLLEAPDEVGTEDLNQALRNPATEFDLSIVVREASSEAGPAPQRPYVVSVYGADHPGIVYRLTSELASRGINVTDLLSRIAGEGIYMMVLDVSLPEELDPKKLAQDLQEISGELGVELTFRPEETAEL